MPTQEPPANGSADSEDYSDDTQREFLDRVMREMLQKPANLRSLASEFVPEEMDHLDFENMRPIERQFFGTNWAKREADIFFEVPYKDAESGMNAFVCVLLEHQSSPDYLIALRTWDYVGRYWDRERRLWEQEENNKGPFRLAPVLPIVFFTSKQKWGSFRKLEQLLGPPKSFHKFAPQWEFLLWELATHSIEVLLASNDAFLQTIAILHAEKADLSDAQLLFERIVIRLAGLQPSNTARWADMLKLLWGWVQNRRPIQEHASWREFAQNLQTREENQKELANMELTIAQALRLEGKKEGKTEGKIEGKIEGAVEMAQQLLLRSGTKRFGVPSAEISGKIRANQDVELISDLVENLSDYDSWQPIAAKL